MGHEAAGGGCAGAAGAAAVAAAATGFARQHTQNKTKRLCVHDDAEVTAKWVHHFFFTPLAIHARKQQNQSAVLLFWLSKKKAFLSSCATP